jgi:hypothetical protein
MKIVEACFRDFFCPRHGEFTAKSALDTEMDEEHHGDFEDDEPKRIYLIGRERV